METFAEIEQAAPQGQYTNESPEQDSLDREAIEAEINAQYELLLSDNDPVNGGHNGLIYRMEATALPAPLKEKLHIETDQAVKVLKVYNSGKAQREYDAQRMAYDLVEANMGRAKDLARVPKPFDFRKINISDETRDRLNREQGTSLSKNQAEVIMMDYVDGAEDLATIFYKWVLKHPPKGKEYITSGGKFDQIQDAVRQMLDFRVPSTKGNESERRAQERLVANDNADKLYRHLKRTGFTLHPAIVKKIANTKALFEEHGLNHNDDHERNFMLKGDYTNVNADDVDVYMLDYGSATINHKPDGTIAFSLETQLKTLVPGVEDQERRIAEDEVIERIQEASRIPEISKKYEAVYKAASVSPIELARSLMIRAAAMASTEQSAENFVALMYRLVNDGQMTNADALGVLDHMKDSMRSPVYKRGKVAGTDITNRAVYNQIEIYRRIFE